MPLDNKGMSVPTEGNVLPAAVQRTMARTAALARQAGMTNVPDEAVIQPVVETPKPQEPVVVQPVIQPAIDQPVDWEQRYKTLQGKYDIEVPAAKSEVQSLRQILAAIQPKNPEPVQPAATPVVQQPTTVEIPDAEIAEYGPELVSAARRWARVELEPVIQELRSEVSKLQTGYSRVVETQDQANVRQGRDASMGYLDNDAEVGKIWRQLNADTQFISWAQQPDELTGQPRLPLLQAAFDQGHGQRSKAVFVRYLREHTGTSVQAPAPVQTPPQQQQQERTRPTLEDLAAPGRSVAQTPPGAQAEKRIWTTQQITAFYRDVNRGVYAEAEPDKIRIERDIIAASTEGRVR